MDSAATARSKRLYKLETTTYNFSVNISSGLANALLLRGMGWGFAEVGLATTSRILAYGLSQIPAILWPAHFRRRRKLIWSVAGAANRIGWSLLVLGVFMPRELGLAYFLLLSSAAQVLGGLAGVAAADLLADLVEIDEAPSFWAKVNKMNYVAVAASFVVSLLPFTAGLELREAYVAAYSAALASALVSTAALLSIKDPKGGRCCFTNGKALVRGALNGSTGRYLAIQAAFNFAVNIPAPFWDYIVLNVLGGNEVVVVLKNAVGLSLKVASIDFWKKRITVAGARRTTSLGMLSTSLVPVLYASITNPWASIAAESYSGFAWSSLDLAGTIYSLYLPRDEERPAFISTLWLTTNMVSSAASLIGSAIAVAAGSVYVPLLISAALRAAVAGAASKALPEVSAGAAG